MLLTPSQIKPKSFESRRNSSSFFPPGVDAPPNTAFRHLPPNSARFSYATEGAHLIKIIRAAVHRRGQRPPKGFGTNMTVEATWRPKHARKHETHPPWWKKEEKVPSRFKRFLFYFSWRKQHGQL